MVQKRAFSLHSIYSSWTPAFSSLLSGPAELQRSYLCELPASLVSIHLQVDSHKHQHCTFLLQFKLVAFESLSKLKSRRIINTPKMVLIKKPFWDGGSLSITCKDRSFIAGRFPLPPQHSFKHLSLVHH